MIRTAWASAPLSFLIVLVAAVLLFEPEPISGNHTPLPEPHSQDLVETDSNSTTRESAGEVVAMDPLAFVIVGPLGETLNEVALRAYGSSEAVATLWEANRDLVHDPEAPLPPGTILKTP